MKNLFFKIVAIVAVLGGLFLGYTAITQPNFVPIEDGLILNTKTGIAYGVLGNDSITLNFMDGEATFKEIK